MTLLEQLKQLYDGLPQSKQQAVANAIRSCPDCGGDCDSILSSLKQALAEPKKPVIGGSFPSLDATKPYEKESNSH